MTTVVAAVVRGGRAFSGGAAARVVGDVGGRCEGASRPFGCCAVMIVCARRSGRFVTLGPSVSSRQGCLQLMRTMRAVFGSAASPDL
jgi:hypothetical protein